MKIRLWAATLVCGLLLTLQARSQQPQGQVQFRSAGNDSMKVVEILHSENYRFEQKNDSIGLTTLVGDVKIKQEKTLIYCDSLIMNPHDNIIECFGHVHINDNDSVNIYSDYMKYLVTSKLVHFDRNVKLTDGKGVLTTENLDYDLALHMGTYDHGGKIVNKESVLTSERGIYFEDTKDIHFKDNVVLRDPQYDLSADSLLYNTQTQVSTFITETFIQFKDSSKRTVRTREGFYDLKNKKAQFGSRPVITDGSQQITGDHVVFDDSTGISLATGNAIYKDTTQGLKLMADYMVTNKKNGTFMATQHPLMIIKQDKDSLYVSADTLASKRLVDFEADQRRLAYEDSLHHIYVDSLEKRSADSLHNVAQARAKRDSVQTVADSIADSQMKDLSDSLRPGQADSLAKLEENMDSAHRAKLDSVISAKRNPHPDSTLSKTDSTGKKLTDSTKKVKPLTPKQIRQKEKDKVRAEIKAEKERQEDIKDSIRTKRRAETDSVKNSIREAKQRAREVYDSTRLVNAQQKARARFVADSTRKRVVSDSLRAIGIIDSNMAHLIKDSSDIVFRRDSLLRLQAADSVRRQQDSLKEVAYQDSIHRPTTDTTLRYIIGYHHVRIYSDSLQAVSDSLYYSTKDSIFRLFYNPVAWGSGNYQITGDTMYVYTKNKKADRLYVFENALAVNKESLNMNMFNQLKGTTINAFLVNGEVDYIRAKGNAESIYYIRDDSRAYTGANRAHADIIDMVFKPKLDSAGNVAVDSAGKSKGRELNRVVLRNDAEGSMIPIKKVVFDDMRLRGFKWQESRRPKSKEELFAPPVENKEEEAAEQLINEGPQQKTKMPQVLVTPQSVKEASAKPAGPAKKGKKSS
jgi:lipopolysaccharide export system protein LptA